jgi:D-3-phosphoglycerate dehydrogenase
MSKDLVIIIDDLFRSYAEERAVLEKIGAELVVLRPEAQADNAVQISKADALLINLSPLPASAIRRLTRCRVISRYGAGYDNIDVPAATAQGIWVVRVPEYGREEVSDHALALLLGCVRKVAHKDRRVRQGGWNLMAEQPCHRIAGGSLGLVGYGAIARALHRKVSGLGLGKVLVFDPFVASQSIQEAGAIPSSFEELLANSDFISLHAPLTPETRHLIGERELAQTKPECILINTARGALVDERALARALASGRLAGAGLDVFETEPLPDTSPLRELPNVILSDHAAWYSEESLVELKTKTAQNAAEVLQGLPPRYPVNSPRLPS